MKSTLANTAAIALIPVAAFLCDRLGSISAGAETFNEYLVADGLTISKTSQPATGGATIKDSTMSLNAFCDEKAPEVAFVFPLTLSIVEPKTSTESVPVEMRLKFQKEGILSGLMSQADTDQIRDYFATLVYDRSPGTDYRHLKFVIKGQNAQDLGRYLVNNDAVAVASSDMKIVYNFDLHGFSDGARSAMSRCSAL